MKQVFLAASLLLIAFSFACKKSGGSGPKSKTELLTQASWKYENAALDLDGNGTADAPLPTGILEACDLDNTITFNSNGSGVVDEGATKCNGADPQSAPFNWSFKNNEQVITFTNMTFAGLDGDVTVKNITETQLEMHKAVTPPVGPSVNVIVYLKH